MARKDRYKDIQLPQLRSFCVAATEASFTAAARRLGISTPTVWQQVRRARTAIANHADAPPWTQCRADRRGKTAAQYRSAARPGPRLSGIAVRIPPAAFASRTDGRRHALPGVVALAQAAAHLHPAAPGHSPETSSLRLGHASRAIGRARPGRRRCRPAKPQRTAQLPDRI